MILGEKKVKKLEKQLDLTRDFINTLPWENKAFYTHFLAQTYYFVCHSTRLLAKSLSHFGIDQDHLYKRFVVHIKEENYHERIAQADLDKLGLATSDFKELAITKAFWERQHYKIDQSKGVSLLGYILYLEAIATDCFDSAYEKMASKFGGASCNFIQVHVAEDKKHVLDAIELINSLSDPEKSIVWDNFYQTAELYHLLLSEVLLDARPMVKGIK